MHALQMCFEQILAISCSSCRVGVSVTAITLALINHGVQFLIAGKEFPQTLTLASSILGFGPQKSQCSWLALDLWKIFK